MYIIKYKRSVIIGFQRSRAAVIYFVQFVLYIYNFYWRNAIYSFTHSHTHISRQSMAVCTKTLYMCVFRQACFLVYYVYFRIAAAAVVYRAGNKSFVMCSDCVRRCGFQSATRSVGVIIYLVSTYMVYIGTLRGYTHRTCMISCIYLSTLIFIFLYTASSYLHT